VVSYPLQFEREAHQPYAIQERPSRQASLATPLLLRQVNIGLQPEDFACVRFAFSPLWETIAAFRVWMNPHPHPLLVPWRAQVSKALSNTDWSLLAELALVPRGRIPDFICPPPNTPMPVLSDELEVLKSAAEGVVRDELRIALGQSAPDLVQRAFTQTPLFLRQLAGLIGEFWQKAIAPGWSILRARLEGEMLHRARLLVLGGLDDLFRGLHRDVTYRQGRLIIRTGSAWDGKERKRGLLLVPSIFSWPDVFLTVRPPWRTAITYPCRGVADLWSETSPPASQGLQQLVGPSCARVIANLEVPRTTLEMSAALRLSPAATSEQITKLWSAGVLDRTRVGRRVFYSLNEKGTILLATLSP
jgi:hypothetical protein